MKQFLKRLFCNHYWNDGVPLNDERPFGLRTFTCDACGAKKVKDWRWGIEYNAFHHWH